MILVQTPLRISFLGGGTDFGDFYRTNGGGAVLSTAIDKYVFVIVKESFDGLVHINYSKKEVAASVDEVQHDLVREAMLMVGVETGVEITTLADVPAEGSGLGSSSSTLVGLLNALHTCRGDFRTAAELADEACTIEITRLGRPIGKQDQYIAAYGNMQLISFRSDDTVVLDKVAPRPEYMKKLERSLMLFYTGKPRQSGSILAEQKSNTSSRQETRDILETLKKLAFDVRDCIMDGAIEEFGVLLHRGWVLKRQLASRISNDEIDGIYELARQAGATGGKITGAGGGGFLLLCCPLEKQESVRSALASLRESPVRFERDGTKVVLNYRR